MLGVMMSCCVYVCVCVRHINLGGKGNALYPVLSSVLYVFTAVTGTHTYTHLLSVGSG